MRATALSLCCSLGIVSVAAESRPCHFPDNPPNQIDVHFKFQDSAVSLHEPVVVLFEVHNRLSQPITVTVGSLFRQFFEFSLTTPDGQVLHRETTPPPTVVTIEGQDKIVVTPGGDYKEPLVMNQWFPFSTQGTYSLTSKLSSDIETQDGSIRVAGQTEQLRVNPRDPVRLNKICAELAKQVQMATDVEVARFPTLELSHVEDPIAVPYLAQVIRAHTLAYASAIPGLERIGNDDAVEVLLSALSENWGDTAELATRSLARMQDRITNPRLKETVKKAVERSTERARNEFIKTQIAYLDYRSPQLQLAAIQSLLQVRDGLMQAEPVLQRLVNDPKQPADVRSAAQDALQRLHSSKN